RDHRGRTVRDLLGRRTRPGAHLRRRRTLQHRADRADRRIPWALPRAPGRSLAAPRDRSGPSRDRRSPRPVDRRRGGRARDQPQRRRRGDGPLHRPPAQVARPPGHSPRVRDADRRRHRVHRRGHARTLSVRPAGDVAMPGLERGDLPPRIVVPPPGPRSRALSAGLERFVAPGISTVAPGRPALVWQEACGANVLDADGNRFIDLTAGFGVAAVGHRHPEVLRAVAAQADLLVHALGDVAAHPGRLALAERLAALAPVDDAQVFFAVSGAEAVEIALKTALAATGRPGVVAFDPGYHGLTLGALAATARPAFRDPFAAHLHPHVARFPFGGDLSPVVARLERDNVASVLVEPIVGREGVLLPPPGWLARLSELCRRAGALLIADEIFTGFGRTGRMFAVEREGVRPDLLCCGKALGGGLPIAAVLGSRAVFRCW